MFKPSAVDLAVRRSLDYPIKGRPAQVPLSKALTTRTTLTTTIVSIQKAEEC